jgi:hypothetical protein
VDDENRQHEETDQPEDWTEVTQVDGISIDRVSCVNGHIAKNMPGDEQDQNEAGNPHNDLSAHRTFQHTHVVIPRKKSENTTPATERQPDGE